LTDTRDEAIEWAAKSTAAIASLPDHPVKQMLIDLADYVVERIN
jgi:octaprenyl-diphosphate synthase